MLNRKFILTFLLGVLVACITAGCSRPSVPKAETKVKLVAVGDVLLARGVGKQIAKHGQEYPFIYTRNFVQEADISFFNLECTLSRRGVSQRRRYLFRADPSLANALRASGFDVACLANNHTLDYGRDALLDTMRATEQSGMIAVGAGADRDDAVRPRIVRRKGLDIGFLAFTDLASCGVVRLNNKPTVAGVNVDEIDDLIKRSRQRCDILVVSFHWGTEYMTRPTQRQKMLAHKAIDCGADVVLGHHPHVLQPVEYYKGRPIIYSMGGFVWDSKVFGSNRSAIFILSLSKSACRVERVIPLTVINGQPHPSQEKISPSSKHQSEAPSDNRGRQWIKFISEISRQAA